MSLRQVIGDGFTIVPGAFDPLSARLIEDAGFPAVYVTGAGISNAGSALPDLGFVSLDQIAATVFSMRQVVQVPLLVDADTGFGGPIQTARTVRVLEQAGANAVQIEDQVSPKRCGHFSNKGVVSRAEMIAKIHAAVDARRSEDLLVIARTDAREQLGLDEALERAVQYREHGADITFVEAPNTFEELQAVGALGGLQLVNMVEGGSTPLMEREVLEELGFTIGIYANSMLRAGLWNMQQLLEHLRDRGSTMGFTDRMVSWAERQRLVQMPMYEALEDKYAAGSDPVASRRE